MLLKLPSTTMRVPRRGGCRYGYDPQRQMLRRRVETVGIGQLGRPYVPDLTVDWSWSGTVSGFDPGVLLKSWGRVAPSCPGTITTALVFGGTGREFSGVGASGLAADGDDPSRACPSTISRELARNGNRLGYRLSLIGQPYSEPDVAKPSKFAEHRGLDGIVEEKLEEW